MVYGVCPMKRTNIYLDDGQTAALRMLGQRQGRPVAQLVREAVDAWLVGQGVRHVDEREWSRRFEQLLGRRRRAAADATWTPEGVERDVALAVADVRRKRPAGRR